MKSWFFVFVVIIALFVMTTVAMEIQIETPPSLATDQLHENEVELFSQLLSQIHSSDNTEQLTVPSLTEMQMIANLASSSYCVNFNIQSLANWTCKACKASGLNLSHGTAWEFAGYHLGAFVGIDQKNNRIWVIFRGSSNFGNWMANLNTGKTSFGGSGHVHKGFLLAYQQARPKIVAAIQKIQSLSTTFASATISVTGHSLGGAVAVLCHLDFQENILSVTNLGPGMPLHVSSSLFPEELPLNHSQLSALGGGAQTTLSLKVPNLLLTFGQPRVGDQKFANYLVAKLGGRYFRATHRNDPIPRLPMQSLGFVHSPQEIYFPQKDDNTTFRMCSGGPLEDSSCIISGLINIALTDHSWYAGIKTTQNTDTCRPQ